MIALNADHEPVALCEECGKSISRDAADQEAGLFFGYGDRIVPLHVPDCGDRYEAKNGRADGEWTFESFLALLGQALGVKPREIARRAAELL
jgi:hypothetical protein